MVYALPEARDLFWQAAVHGVYLSTCAAAGDFQHSAVASKQEAGYLLDMEAHLTRWGNSLGLRIPKSLAGRFRLVEGMRVELEAEHDRIVISMPARYALESLLAGMTSEMLRDAFEWGPDEGREIIG